MVIEELLGLPGPVHHLVINTGDVEHQTHHQAEACVQHITPETHKSGHFTPTLTGSAVGRQDEGGWK